MKKGLSIFFLVVLLLPSIYKIGFKVYFQLNKEFIAANYCVNKDRPITMCYGKCFLEKGLQITDHVPNPDSLVAQLKFEISEFVFDDFEFSASTLENNLVFSAPATPLLSDGIFSSVFRPPLA